MLYKKTFLTPLGEVLSLATEDAIYLLEFSDQKNLNTALEKIQKQLNTKISSRQVPLFVQLEDELNEYFSGSRLTFTVPLAMQGTVFQQKVWHVLQTIPYGQTVSYLEQAKALDSPSSVRAVANANGRNLISIIIPCHRVIGNNGHLTGYAGGLWRKQWLLNHEKTIINNTLL